MAGPAFPHRAVRHGFDPLRDSKFNAGFARTYSTRLGRLSQRSIMHMPSETYDNVWAKAGPLTVASQYLTSDQCLGCHSAGGTGLQFDMTEPAADDKLVNNSPYGTWKGSPMGLAGRDPFFFAQLASETETFHPTAASTDRGYLLRLSWHPGPAASRDRLAGSPPAAAARSSRTTVDATPYPADDPVSRLANYGALARDGVSCTACHRMVLGQDAIAKHGQEPQNACVLERQEALNPGLTGFAKSFTGSFLSGPPDKLYGPFQDPKKVPMHRAIGSEPHTPRI